MAGHHLDALYTLRRNRMHPLPTAPKLTSGDLEAIHRGDVPLSDAVYQAISSALRQHRFATGSRLVEGDLATALGVSRTPVRDALRRLESDGLVHSEPNRGYVVVDLMEDAAHVFLIRERLEGLAAGMAAASITRPELEELDGLQARMEQIVGREPIETETLVELNGLLHQRITEASRSPRLIQLIARLNPQYMSYQVLRLYSDAQRRRSIREHREILDALWRRDSDAAERGIHQHLEHGKAVVLSEMTKKRIGRGTKE